MIKSKSGGVFTRGISFGMGTRNPWGRRQNRAKRVEGHGSRIDDLGPLLHGFR
jgi:hypothetical protein